MKFSTKHIGAAAILLLFGGWGSVGHKIINQKTTQGFPFSMSYFTTWSTDLGNHASDADNRKNSDPNESPRHFIDIDSYAEFVQNGSINQDYDYNVNLHGSTFVIDQGTLPWTILRTVDSLKLAFQQGNWNKAMLKAADLGHYVGDGHMPMHITTNYDGQLTGQKGVHSRYESTMIGNNQTSLVYSIDSAEYVANKSQYVFDFIYSNYKYVDSVLKADSISKALAGSYNTTYYTNLWSLTGTFTRDILFRKASKRLSDLIYTAWVDAGSPNSTNPTPVELISFNSTVVNSNVELKWNTATENNNRGFEVLRRSNIDNSSWRVIGFVAGSGTTTNNHSYSFTDKNLSQTGKYFYKLKQIDYNGFYEYSNEVEADIMPMDFSLEQNYPNPFNPVTVIKFHLPITSSVSLRVYDMLGNEVAVLLNGVTTSGVHEVSFNGSNLSSGLYIYRFETPYYKESRKLLLLK